MAQSSKIIIATIKRLVAYVAIFIALGFFAYQRKLTGYEGYVLNALIALAALVVAEYRTARAELRLAALEPKKPSPIPTTQPARQVQASGPPKLVSPTRKSEESPRIEKPRAEIRFPVIPKSLAIALAVLIVAFIVYIVGW
jgi:hypothetical protein